MHYFIIFKNLNQVCIDLTFELCYNSESFDILDIKTLEVEVVKISSFKNVKSILRFVLIVVVFMFSNIVFADSLDEIKARGSLKVSTSADYFPLSFIEGKEVAGIEIEIMKKIAEKWGVKAEISDISFDVQLMELANGKVDCVISAMSSSPEREKSVDFSVPYLTSDIQIIVKKDSTIKDSNGLEGKRIGAQNSSSCYEYCIANFKNAEVVPYGKPTEAVIDLINSRVDAVVLNDLPAVPIVENYKSDIKILSEPLFKEEYKIAVLKGNTRLLTAINREIESLKSSGEIKKILEKYKLGSTEKHSEFYNNLILKDRYKVILKGLLVTFQISVSSLIIGILIGYLLCYIKIHPCNNIVFKVLKKEVDIYVSITRGTPILVQLFFVYYVILSPLGMNGILVSIIVLGLNSGAYVTEIMRAGFMAIDKGQTEASMALGMNYKQTMRNVLIPQALKNITPSLCNEFISLVKETSMVGFISVIDLTKASEIIRNQTYQPLVPILTTAVLYFSISCVITFLMKKLERRLQYGNKS